MIINDLYNNKKYTVAEGMDGKVVFRGTSADGSTYEIIQSGPTDFMIHANGRHIDTYGSLQRAMSVLKNEVPGLQQGMAEDDDAVAAFLARGGEVQRLKPAKPRKGERWQGSAHIGAAGGRGTKGRVSGLAANTGKSSKPVVTAEQGVSEVSLGDYRKKATVNKAMAQTNKFFGRDDPAAVAAADQTIAKREKGLGRADARSRPYNPPPQDAEKQQRDLTARYPNIDELVRRAEVNRDPNYEYADGQAYFDGREAEQNYQKLKQIQRVIQGLNESLDRSHLP